MSNECKTYSNNAYIPKRAYPGFAGYDLWEAETKLLKHWSRDLIRLDLFMAIPEGYYGRIVGPSGSANVHGIIYLFICLFILFIICLKLTCI